MTQQDLLALIDKYLDGTATEEEKGLLNQYYNTFSQTGKWCEAELGDEAETEQRILDNLIQRVHRQPVKTVPLYQRTWVKLAAAFILLFISTWWFFKKEEGFRMTAVESPEIKNPVTGKQTTLTLADGSVVVLDGKPDGLIANTANNHIRKKGKTITIVAVGKKKRASPSGFYTLKTPKGQQYKLVLEDGSQVWLNTASSFRFPAVFAEDERKVDLTGEGYFEVTKDAARPFRVLALGQEGGGNAGTMVEVLGTHFNLNAYDDEEVTKTTLLEGSVKVSMAGTNSLKAASNAVLAPGEQAEVSARQSAAQTVRVKRADAAEVLAWTSNVFHFNNTGLQNIMRQLARWYDVEVVYANKVPPRNFSGKISRNAPLSTVLQILEQSNIRFTVKGKQIIVRS